MTDYRSFRLSKLNDPEFSHVKLLLFWPLYCLLFTFVERFYPVETYIPMHCALDDVIPFCEFFLIPYVFWFVFLIGMIVYLFFFDVPAFRRIMYFIMITYMVTIIIYLIFPTCQDLRPEVFPRDNVLTRFMADYYEFDTNTNVCPSIHVIGSVAVMLASFDTKRFSSFGWRTAFTIATILISVSTVFVKQHSVLDVLLAIPLCAIAYFVVYKLKGNK